MDALKRGFRVAVYAIGIIMVAFATIPVVIIYGGQMGIMGSLIPKPVPRTVPTARLMSCEEVKHLGDAGMLELLWSPDGKNFRLPDQRVCQKRTR